MGEVQILHEDWGLQLWDFFQLYKEGVLNFFPIKQSVADTHNSIEHGTY